MCFVASFITPPYSASSVGGTSLSILVSWLVLSVMMGYDHLAGISSGVALASTR
jgi:hypothetical protein